MQDGLKLPPCSQAPGNQSCRFPPLRKPAVRPSATGALSGVQAFQKLGPMGCVETTAIAALLNFAPFRVASKLPIENAHHAESHDFPGD